MVSANKHGPLAPAPPAISSSSSSAKKRKRGDDAPPALAQKSITIRPCPTLPSDRPITLTPVKLIERSQLPLSFLDVTGGSSAAAALPSTRLFSAHVDALERRASDHDDDDDHDDDEQEGEEEDVPATPKVLVTRLEADGSLCAVERVRRGVYALCKLGAWVREEDVGAVPALEEADPFVDSAAERVPLAGAGQPPVEGVEERPPQTAEEVFQAVVHQYLEALYLTKTSLAFFVKGPMSRARAAFTSKENTGLKMGDLAAFMRSILLQPGPMDKKHREKLPEIVKSMPLPGLSDDEDAVAAKVDKKKKSKSKKLKPNKDGLYPGEDEHVKKWWLQDRPGSSPHGHKNAAAHQPPPRHPSLTRSSTDPLLLPPNLKREGSDAPPSLSSIPLHQQKETSQTSASRNSLSQFERFSRRTIDLDAMSKSNEAKLKKKAHVERELEKAIGTLRKPNRGAALKDVADTADSRRQQAQSLSSSSSSRGNGGGVSKPGVPRVTRKAGGGNNTVLVGATPKRGRKTKDIVLQAATPNHNRFVTATTTTTSNTAAASDHPDGDDNGADVAPPGPSDDPIIPSSAVRPGPVDFLAPGGFGCVPASAGKEKEVEVEAEEGGLGRIEEEDGAEDIYNALGWDDDIDELA
ncbi:putative dna replication regulator sld3 [Diplodia seriata]|uniref:Putative dna replication regulator sld3 n=1 Tax=Diplodia seriata TaxID=420778 RepID=A0A0G2E819_9PEZI|nr:putative dna replication regulator sld3 [Diplodia seriata]